MAPKKKAASSSAAKTAKKGAKATPSTKSVAKKKTTPAAAPAKKAQAKGAAKKSPAKPAASKKPAAAKKSPAKKSPAKKAPAKKSPATKSPAKKSPGKKSAAPKPAKKSADKKSATKKSVETPPKASAKKAAPVAKKETKKSPSMKKTSKKTEVAEEPKVVPKVMHPRPNIRPAGGGRSILSRNTEPDESKRLTKTPYDKAFLKKQKAVLLSEREKHAKQAASLLAEAESLMADREPGDVQFDEESGEGDTLAVERERDLALSAQNRVVVEQIDAALDRMEKNVYGVCVESGLEIPKARLEAIPWAPERVEYKTGGFKRR